MEGTKSKIRVGLVVGLSALIAFSGLYGLLKPIKNRCTMTYMYPTYIPVKSPKNSSSSSSSSSLLSKYGLYLYHEGWKKIDFDAHVKQINGVPVLFVPGNGGSYKQKVFCIRAGTLLDHVMDLEDDATSGITWEGDCRVHKGPTPTPRPDTNGGNGGPMFEGNLFGHRGTDPGRFGGVATATYAPQEWPSVGLDDEEWDAVHQSVRNAGCYICNEDLSALDCPFNYVLASPTPISERDVQIALSLEYDCNPQGCGGWLGPSNFEIGQGSGHAHRHQEERPHFEGPWVGLNPYHPRNFSRVGSEDDCTSTASNSPEEVISTACLNMAAEYEGFHTHMSTNWQWYDEVVRKMRDPRPRR